MKISIFAVAAAFVIGGTGVASAAHAPSHRHHSASAYNALSLNAYRAVTAAPTWSFQDGGGESHQTATGGPVGGIN